MNRNQLQQLGKCCIVLNGLLAVVWISYFLAVSRPVRLSEVLKIPFNDFVLSGAFCYLLFNFKIPKLVLKLAVGYDFLGAIVLVAKAIFAFEIHGKNLLYIVSLFVATIVNLVFYTFCLKLTPTGSNRLIIYKHPDIGRTAEAVPTLRN
jgi:hypothetical protein